MFGFARNVLARAISQYQYLTHYMGPGCPLVSWDDFCADPFTLGDACFAAAAAGKRCCDPVSALHQYVHAAPQAHCFATVDGAPAVDWLGRWASFLLGQQAAGGAVGACRGAGGLPCVPPSRTHFPPLHSLRVTCRVEHLEEDFDALLELLNARPGVPQLPPRPPAWDKANFHNSTCTPSSAAGGGGSSSDGGGAAAEQGRRRLRQLHRGTVWQAREGTFLPCDELDYFRGEHAHCHADLLSFFAEDVAFLQLQDQ